MFLFFLFDLNSHNSLAITEFEKTWNIELSTLHHINGITVQSLTTSSTMGRLLIQIDLIDSSVFKYALALPKTCEHI